jgi:hypothetical protein
MVAAHPCIAPEGAAYLSPGHKPWVAGKKKTKREASPRAAMVRPQHTLTAKTPFQFPGTHGPSRIRNFGT